MAQVRRDDPAAEGRAFDDVPGTEQERVRSGPGDEPAARRLAGGVPAQHGQIRAQQRRLAPRLEIESAVQGESGPRVELRLQRFVEPQQLQQQVLVGRPARAGPPQVERPLGLAMQVPRRAAQLLQQHQAGFSRKPNTTCGLA
jgi:hypothetical protein